MSSSAQGNSPVNRGLYLLSIDGGGIRGLSALFILQELLHRLKERQKLERTPLPCELFDLAGGTSTGGLIAIMLFRLKMSVEDAIKAYTSVAKTVFTSKKLPHKEGTFKATLLRSSIVEVIMQTQLVDETDARGMRMLDKEGPKCFVCAMSAHDMAFPTRFRSWIPPTNPSYNCSIVEAAHATSAAPTFFKSVAIGDENLKQIYVDGGLRVNNPVKYVISEAESAFPNRKISCLLSLGTGLPEVIGLDEPDSFQKMVPSKLIKVLKGIATDCEAASEDVEKDFHGTGTYFRLNVDAGLEKITLAEWTSLKVVQARTVTYLQKEEVERKLNQLLVILENRLTEHN